MLYLFLTGKAGTYLNDIFTSLYLPSEMSHVYKFNSKICGTFSEEESNTDYFAVGEDTLILFLDRKRQKHKNFFYIPLRMGKLLKRDIIDGQCYFTIQMKEYCAAYNPEYFTESLSKMVGKYLYQKQEDGRYRGFLALSGKKLNLTVLNESEDSWIVTVRRLGEKEFFRKGYAVFTRLEVKDRYGNNQKVICHNGEYGYELKEGEKYKLAIPYYIPDFNEKPETRISVILNEDIGVLKKKHIIECKQNILSTPIYVSGKNKEQLSEFEFIIPETTVGNKVIWYSHAATNVWVKGRTPKWLRRCAILLCVIGIGVAAFGEAFPYEEMILRCQGKTELDFLNLALYQLSLWRKKYFEIYGVCLAGLTTVSTYFLVKLTGRAEL